MGIQAYKQAWSTADLLPTARLVLLALAEHIRDTGEGWCWPSHDTLADMVGIDRRSVIRQLKRLESAGHIAVDRKPGWTNRYRLTCDTSVTGRGDTSVTRGVTLRAKRGDTSVTQTLRTINNQGGQRGIHATPTPPPFAAVMAQQDRLTQ